MKAVVFLICILLWHSDTWLLLACKVLFSGLFRSCLFSIYLEFLCWVLHCIKIWYYNYYYNYQFTCNNCIYQPWMLLTRDLWIKCWLGFQVHLSAICVDCFLCILSSTFGILSSLSNRGTKFSSYQVCHMSPCYSVHPYNMIS